MGSTGVIMPKLKLGSQGLEVSRMGLGCASLSEHYNDPTKDEEGIDLIKQAYKLGITLFATSDFYGKTSHQNEILVGRALKHFPRHQVQVSTKFGFKWVPGVGPTVNGKPEYVREACEASLKALDVDYIDLFYQHRVDMDTPIEETVGEMKKLVEEGKVKYIGLSEAGPDIIRRAHAVHPITAIQMDWSLWACGTDKEIVPLCRELGISIVTYAPLERGFFAGKPVVEDLPDTSSLKKFATYSGEKNLDSNKILHQTLDKIATKHSCTTAQLALAWLLHRGDHTVLIPGTTQIMNLVSDIGTVQVKVSKEDMDEIMRKMIEID